MNHSRKATYLLLSLYFILISCSSSDDDRTSFIEGITSEVLVFPLASGNSWTYRVGITDNNTREIIINTETVSISESTQENDEIIGTTDDSDNIEGFMTQLFTNAELRFENERLVVNGRVPLSIPGFEDFSIEFPEVALYDNTLTPSNNFLTRDIGGDTREINGNTIRFSYVIQTLNGPNFESFEFNLIDAFGFGNFIESTIDIGLSVSLEIEENGEVVLIPIIPFDHVFQIRNVYAANLGLVESVVEFNYNVNDIEQFNLELPLEPNSSFSSTTLQELQSFNLN